MENSNVSGNLMYLTLLVVVIVSLFLQIYLSKREDKISGLILPAIFFFRSLGSVFDLWGSIATIEEILMVVAVQNGPTIIFIVIYILGRRKIKRDKEIEKMNIKDLE